MLFKLLLSFWHSIWLCTPRNEDHSHYQQNTTITIKNHFIIQTMKSHLSTYFMLIFSFCSISVLGDANSSNGTGKQTTPPATERLQVMSSPDLSGLTSNWVAEFNQLHPDYKIIVKPTIDEQPFANDAIYLLSDYTRRTQNESNWKLVVGHDIIVPIVNSKNPSLPALFQRGITAEELSRILLKETNWTSVTDGLPDHSIRCLTIDNPKVIETISNYSERDVTTLQFTKVATAEALISAVQNDQLAIGFCKLTDVIQSGENAFIQGISILPIDRNGNGRLDSFEKIYNSPQQLTHAAWMGKYPRALSGNIYALASSKPTDQSALEFLTWLNKDGQNYLEGSGYSILAGREQNANLSTLSPDISQPVTTTKPVIPFGWKLGVAAVTIVLLIVVIARSKRHTKSDIDGEDIAVTEALNEHSIKTPSGLYYDKSHTWAYREPDGMVIVGICDFMQHLTGPLSRVKMKLPGEKVRKGEKIVTLVHEGKQLELYAPVSGTIQLSNERLQEQPTSVNHAPYTDGWIYLIEPLNWHRELRFLLVAEKYREWIDDEFTRLKDFLANTANANEGVFNQLILQDGGELTDHVLANLSPDIWEDFQTQFIDKAR